ncbi:DUF6966 domain-containing protein [Arthrobacter sp. zg-Y1110]|uniref:DUF6966 domain-containing protein n=1 Tax=Arthrobacter sp. zg-Y1110 TaxID=2886932 RepID=UPI001D1575E0|nr:hypothetical protein [Arthrobacter sp. zg-Y1110]MCC3291839.1 hypothetical protein [Arthrobacter sp. zg-Y1110]UWX85668.1 hypothetical protein N2K99_03715 [Arthrobacter sp. zg-Y1110]
MPQSVEDVRDEILSAASAVRAAARVDDDEWRSGVANRIEHMFAGITEVSDLRERAADCLRLYGGMGSFADVGTEAMAGAVNKLRVPLVRARTFALDQTGPR